MLTAAEPRAPILPRMLGPWTLHFVNNRDSWRGVSRRQPRVTRQDHSDEAIARSSTGVMSLMAVRRNRPAPLSGGEGSV